MVRSILARTSTDDDLRQYAEDISFDHLDQFLINVFSMLSYICAKNFIFKISFHVLLDGEVSCNSGPMTGKQIFQFLTGSWIVPRVREAIEIQVHFQQHAKNVLPRPIVSTCLGTVQLPLTRSLTEMTRAWVSAIDEGGVEFTRP